MSKTETKLFLKYNNNNQPQGLVYHSPLRRTMNLVKLTLNQTTLQFEMATRAPPLPNGREIQSSVYFSSSVVPFSSSLDFEPNQP